MFRPNMLKIICILYGIINFTSCDSHSENSDSSKQEERNEYILSNKASMPEARQEIYPEEIHGSIYILAGFNSNKAATRSFFKYDISKNTWKSLATLPIERHHITISYANSKIYAIGGYYGDLFDWTIKDDIFEFDSLTNTWLTFDKMLSARAEHISAVVDGKIYIIGGTDQFRSTSNKNEMYDPSTKTWTVKSKMPTARNSAARVVINEKIYVIAGRYKPEGGQITNLSSFEVYDTKNDQWSILADLPIKSGGLMAAVLENKIFVFGGEYFNSNGGGIYSSIFCYDLHTNSWAKVKKTSLARHGTQALSYKDKIYIIGGADQVAFAATASNIHFERISE